MIAREPRRITQCRPVVAIGREHRLRVGFEQVGAKVIWMLHRHDVRSKATGRKVLQVAGNNDIHSALDRCGRHMAVVRIRHLKHGSERPVARHDGIETVFDHGRAGPFQHARGDVGPAGQQVAHAFRMSVDAPKQRVQIPVGVVQK